MAALPLLEASELRYLISDSVAFTSSIPTGQECNCLLEMLNTNRNTNGHGKDVDNDNDDESRAVYKTTIRYLQLGFDALRNQSGKQAEMIFLWAMLVPAEYMSMLAERRPRALIVLAFYTVLLRFGKHHWQVGDVGEYLFGLIEARLGSEWEYQLSMARCIGG